jgi:hypothetical protein
MFIDDECLCIGSPMVTPSMKYRPEIDGLRGVAVLLVLLFHADVGVAGGFVGVDVFFVISGYLITRILLRELASPGPFVLTHFWRRRICRIGHCICSELFRGCKRYIAGCVGPTILRVKCLFLADNGLLQSAS